MPNTNKNTPMPQCDKNAVMQWFFTEDKLPMCYETGNWDGKKSDLILAETITGKQFLAECYEGTMDGSYFFDWYFVDTISKNDWCVNETISRWLTIPF
jgi:hypothetical protein